MSKEYERRESPTLESIAAMISELSVKLELHIQQERQLNPHIQELIDILQKSKGVIAFFKVCIFIGAPLAALVTWIKEHVKL